MNTKKENVKIFTREEFKKLESKWYIVEECVPPKEVNVLVTIIDFEAYPNYLNEQESYEKIRKLGVMPTQQGACCNTNGTYKYIVKETYISIVFSDRYYWRLDYPAARIIAWMPKPKIEPFKGAKLDLSLNLIKDNYLSISDKLIKEANIIYK